MALASWIFGSLLLIFLVAFCFIIPEPTPSQAQIMHFIMAALSGFFAYFFVGDAVLKGNIKGQKLAAGGGFALFLVMQFLVDPSELRSAAGAFFPNWVRSDARIKDAQTILQRMHLLNKEPDGVRDIATSKALREFQERHDLRPDSLLSKETVAALHQLSENSLDRFHSMQPSGSMVPSAPVEMKSLQTNSSASESSPEKRTEADIGQKPLAISIKRVATESFAELLSKTENRTGVNYVLSIFSRELASNDPNNFWFDVYEDTKSGASFVTKAGVNLVSSDNHFSARDMSSEMEIDINERGDSSLDYLMSSQHPPTTIDSESEIHWTVDPRWSLPSMRWINYPNGAAWGRVAWSGSTLSSRFFAVTIITVQHQSVMRICVSHRNPVDVPVEWMEMDLAAHFSGFNSN